MEMGCSFKRLCARWTLFRVFGVISMDSCPNWGNVIGMFDQSGSVLAESVVSAAAALPIDIRKGLLAPFEFVLEMLLKGLCGSGQAEFCAEFVRDGT